MAVPCMTRRRFLTISAMSAASLAVDWRGIAVHAARMGPKEDYPTVVIGAGLGGLCCAAFLARQGIPVTILEKHEIPGGYATAFDRGGGKYRFEVSLHGTSIRGNHVERTLSELGVLEKLRLVELPETYRVKAPGMDVSFPQRDPEAFIRSLGELFPREADGIRGFVEEVLNIFEETEKYGRQSGFFKTVLKPIFPLQFRRMWNVRNQTLSDLLDDHVQDPQARDMLSAMWGYYGLPPSRLSGFYYAVATGGYLKNGSYYIQDRSQALSDLLAETVEQGGGKVLYETEAKRIQLRDGAVAGVETADGRVLPARAVVSNASALTTLQDMVPSDAVPAETMKRLSSLRPSISCFIVWLGLNREIRGTIPGFSTSVATGRGPEDDYASCLQGDVDRCGFSVTLFDNLYEGYSRPGTSSIMLLCLSGYGPWQRFEADYRAGRKQAYEEEKQRWTETLIRRAEESVIPGLRSMIEVREAASPLTCLRYTGNTEGAIYGFEQSMDNAFMNRMGNRTPVKGLYLASAWGNPGGGYGGVLRAGEMTFQHLMEDWGG